MNEEPLYNDAQDHDFPLPDPNKAWQKMEAMLDEDERRRRPLPWWAWRTASGVLFLVALAFGGWLWLRSGTKEENKTTAAVAAKQTPQTTTSSKDATTVGTERTPTINERKASQRPSSSPDENNLANLKTSTANLPAAVQKSGEPQTTVALPLKEGHSPLRQRHKKAPAQGAIASSALPTKPAAQKVKPNDAARTKYNGDGIDAAQTEAVKTKDASADVNTAAIKKKDSLPLVVVTENNSANKKDSVKTLPATPAAETIEKKAAPKKKPLVVWSAGIGLQQAIALQRQSSTASDSLGRKRPFFDYYPSVYVKVQRGKWAAQVEFQYGVPQPVAALPFNQKTTYDAGAMTTTVERYTVQRLYYHQLPVSLSYFVLPQWSVGAGGVYNIFSGAVTQREVISKYAVTGAEVLSKNAAAIKGYTDSFFYKTTAGVLLQTDYQWKRFSLGLRYAQNLQPFIKYTSPDGNVMDKKSNSLQAVLRFRLWASR